MPHRCPICGADAALEPSFPAGDSTCPACGHLLWWFRDRLGRASGLTADQIRLASTFPGNLRVTSLETVELVMELEEEFDLVIPDEDAEAIRTVGDAIRYLRMRRGGSV
ncbi:Acyl carrier protein [Fimbriiglobus ruber]|uniref:Acyl carrier protein n=2 Tax=Fimbriiglobus ruber TaxID=1908690 RepID=A0A225D7Y1_9BACT|nr:phosphopantetheine-binding protein [Fimbriiglobus ruber]OWK37562.1 Acyl carrier protein [Fimbriiglobus ruber]